MNKVIEVKVPRDTASLRTMVNELVLRVAHLEQENAELRQEIVELRQENVELRQENTRLLERLNQDSHNSHRPPSSDGYRKQRAFPKPPEHRGRRPVGRRDIVVTRRTKSAPRTRLLSYR